MDRLLRAEVLESFEKCLLMGDLVSGTVTSRPGRIGWERRVLKTAVDGT